MRNRLAASPSPEKSDDAKTSAWALPSSDELFGRLRQGFGLDLESYREDLLRPLFARRMTALGASSSSDYLEIMRRNASEQARLMEALLVGSTAFFRDPLSFGMLRDYMTALEVPEAGFRAWVPGCSTGQEAYSVAILLAEVMERRRVVRPLRVFATDVRPKAVDTAREGRFPRSLVEQVSPERVRRWFIPDGSGYRACKRLREAIVFGHHDVLRDPPFARVDLISCRNLLLYLRHDAQAAVLERFHFALRPSGRLFLGASESPAATPGIYVVHDREHRVYTKNPRCLRPPSFL